MIGLQKGPKTSFRVDPLEWFKITYDFAVGSSFSDATLLLFLFYFIPFFFFRFLLILEL